MDMFSLRTIIDDILLIVRNNNISESEDLSRDQIAAWVLAYKAFLAKKQQDKDKETGEEITYTYSYQGSLMNLIGVIFRGGLSDVAGYLADNVADAWPAVSYLAEAVKLDGTEEALPYYYGAAKELHAFLSDASDIPIDLSVKDMYAVQADRALCFG